METVVIIGSGNMAHALTHAFSEAGMPPVQIFARNRARAAETAAICGCPFVDNPEELAQADLYIIAVTDKAIRSVAAGLDFGSAVVAHTAASVGLDVFPQKIHNRGVLYPLQTLTRGRKIDLRQVPVLIEGNNPHSLECVRSVAQAISDRVIVADSNRRAMVHAAAVFASNFTNYMYAVGDELVREAGFDFSLLRPLVMETAYKAVESGDPRKVQTGPATRNDFQTKSRHCELLAQKPELKNMYTNISNSIWEISKKI